MESFVKYSAIVILTVLIGTIVIDWVQSKVANVITSRQTRQTYPTMVMVRYRDAWRTHTYQFCGNALDVANLIRSMRENGGVWVNTKTFIPTHQVLKVWVKV